MDLTRRNSEQWEILRVALPTGPVTTVEQLGLGGVVPVMA